MPIRYKINVLVDKQIKLLWNFFENLLFFFGYSVSQANISDCVARRIIN